MTWEEIDTLSGRLAALLQQDRFSAELLSGALLAAQQINNPIRGNLFAGALRELVTYTLHSLAPDVRVEGCSWYRLEPKTNGPTRRQRATYVIQGGLSDDFVRRELGLDPDKEHKLLTGAMADLNKRTHVRPDTAVREDRDVRKLVSTTLTAFIGLLDIAERCRELIENALVDVLDQEIMDQLIGDIVGELDELSTHTRVDEHSIEVVEVASLDEAMVTYSVTGKVFVELQYGSDADVRNDFGAISSDSFPYAASVRASGRSPQGP